MRTFKSTQHHKFMAASYAKCDTVTGPMIALENCTGVHMRRHKPTIRHCTRSPTPTSNLNSSMPIADKQSRQQTGCPLRIAWARHMHSVSSEILRAAPPPVRLQYRGSTLEPTPPVCCCRCACGPPGGSLREPCTVFGPSEKEVHGSPKIALWQVAAATAAHRDAAAAVAATDATAAAVAAAASAAAAAAAASPAPPAAATAAADANASCHRSQEHVLRASRKLHERRRAAVWRACY
jgi:hypothetical protein